MPPRSQRGKPKSRYRLQRDERSTVVSLPRIEPVESARAGYERDASHAVRDSGEA